MAADVDSSPGLEWVGYARDAEFYWEPGSVIILDQSGDQLNTFNVFGKDTDTDKARLAVGELSEDYSGLEIAVCKQHPTYPRIRVYSYVAGVATRIESFLVDGSCEAIAIGDGDGNGENEIVTIQERHERVRAYTKGGRALYTTDLPSYEDSDGAPDTGPDTIREMELVDITGDSAAEIIVRRMYDSFDSSAVIVAYSKDGEQINSFGFGRDFATMDYDGDSIMDVVILKNNKKVTINIFSSSGNLLTTFDACPNRTSNPDKSGKYLFAGSFRY